MKLVLVTWLDSHAGTGWLSKEQLESAVQPLQCQSVGWLFAKNKTCTVIVPHFTDMGHGRGEISIPSKAVIKIQALRKP